MNAILPPLLAAAAPVRPAALPTPPPRTGTAAVAPAPHRARQLGRALRGYGAARRPFGRAALLLALIFGDY